MSRQLTYLEHTHLLMKLGAGRSFWRAKFLSCPKVQQEIQQHARLRDSLFLLQGVLCDLDVGEESVLHDTLIMDGLQPVRTVLESDFGQAICDVNYFHSLRDRPREDRIYICGSYSEAAS